LRLSGKIGGHALLSMTDVSRVGLGERFAFEETRLAGGLNIFLLVRDQCCIASKLRRAVIGLNVVDAIDPSALQAVAAL